MIASYVETYTIIARIKDASYILLIKPPVADGFVFANDPYFRDFLDLLHFWNSVLRR